MTIIMGRIKRAWSFECSFKGTACCYIGYEDFKVKLISTTKVPETTSSSNIFQGVNDLFIS
jgi:hypothetical protein